MYDSRSFGLPCSSRRDVYKRQVLKLEEGTKFMVLAPVVRQRKGTPQKELEAARRAGYARVKIDGNLYDLDEEITLEKNIKHTDVYKRQV